jgi:hypothetical protein
MHFWLDNSALSIGYERQHKMAPKSIWLQSRFFAVIEGLKLNYLRQMLIDRVHIFKNKLYNYQLTKKHFPAPLCLRIEAKTRFYQADLLFRRFCILGSTFKEFCDGHSFERDHDVQLFMLSLNIGSKLTTVDILGSNNMSRKICPKINERLVFLQ